MKYAFYKYMVFKIAKDDVTNKISLFSVSSNSSLTLTNPVAESSKENRSFGWAGKVTYSDYKFENIGEIPVENIMITDDPFDIIWVEGHVDWLIEIKMPNGAWIAREFEIGESVDFDNGIHKYLAVNLANTPLLDQMQKADPDLDTLVSIYELKDYRLYHKEKNNYYLVHTN